MKIDAIMLTMKDNVATALRDINAQENIVIGTENGKNSITVYQPISYGHKFAIKDIAKGEKILKYGEVIGQATELIKSGTHAHIHNIESLRGRGDIETEVVK